MESQCDRHGSVCYQIKVKGQLDQRWEDWFEGMTIKMSKDFTILTGLVTDQSALHGVLNRIRDLNLTLISVELVNITDSIAQSDGIGNDIDPKQGT